MGFFYPLTGAGFQPSTVGRHRTNIKRVDEVLGWVEVSS